MSWVLSIAKLLSPNLFQRAKSTNVIQMITISFSHYCELASWSLVLGNKKFEEHSYAPGQHILPTLALRVGGEKKYFAGTSRMCKVSTANDKPVDEKKQVAIDKKARSTTVPAAVFPDGSVVCDSWDISSKSGLSEIDPSLKKLLDEELGPLARQAAYIHMLKPANKNVFDQLFSENKHWVWRLIWRIYAGNYLRNYMIKFMKPFDATANKICKEKLTKVTDELGSLITNKKTPFLGGNTIGIADVAVASLFAPLVTPPLYCNGQFTHIFDKLEQQDPEVHKESVYWRNTVVGEYTMNLYKNHRVVKGVL